MNRLVPFSTKWSPSRTAEVVSAPASDPESGSVRQNAAINSPVARGRTYLARCPSFPSWRMLEEPSPLLMPVTERKAGAARHSSKKTWTDSSALSPSPPNSAGMVIP